MTQPISGFSQTTIQQSTQKNSSPNPFGRTLATAVAPNGFIDLDPTGAMVTGRDVLSQRLARRLLTPKGSLIGYPNDGIDVRQLISQGMTSSQVSRISALVQAEILRDQAVLPSSTVQSTYNYNTNVLTILLLIQSGYGPFSLTLQIGQVTVAILQASK